jgi:nicotinamide-nucleotide amidase
VHVAVVGPGVDRVRALRLAGDRAAVRAASVTAALELLADALPGGPNG